MFKKLQFKINGIRSQNDKALIETEIDILEGVKDIDVDCQTGKARVKFDDVKISVKKIFEVIEELDYIIEIENKKEPAPPALKEHFYFVKGMHCASCEILIEKKLLKIENVKSVEASANKGQVLIEYENKLPRPEKLNQLFREEDYIFFDQPVKNNNNYSESNSSNSSMIFVTAGVIILGFFMLQKLGLTQLLNVNAKSSLPMFFLFGILAGVSSCAALVGGLVLSMSKQWMKAYADKESTAEKLQPHLLFNAGRLISYAFFGALLGIVGSKLQISLTLASFLTISVSIMMIFLALQMLGLKYFRRFQFTMPKFITRHITDESKFNGKYMPFSMGALTFFLPCGFTITAQSLALLSGNPIQGGLIMFFFALGTLPMLLLIGFSSVKFSQKPHLANKFLKIAGVLVLFFALYNLNAQLNVLGFTSLNNFKLAQLTNASEEGLAPIINGKQVLKMNASAFGYQPNYFKVKAGIPVRWEITDTGTSGCTNAIISRSLFDGQIPLIPGQTAIKEFTPQKEGKYKFSCWMGMISGVIEVVGENGSLKAAASNGNNAVIPSGASGCGGGGSSGGGGGCGGSGGGCGGGSR